MASRLGVIITDTGKEVVTTNFRIGVVNTIETMEELVISPIACNVVDSATELVNPMEVNIRLVDPIEKDLFET